jgi:site-specific recombinase XerD
MYKKLMGHSDIKITMIYAKVVNADLDDLMELFG